MTSTFFWVRTLVAACALFGLASCAGTSSSLAKKQAAASKVKVIPAVRTTAYTHTEKDHLIHGVRTAVGSNLKFGKVRSAAAE